MSIPPWDKVVAQLNRSQRVVLGTHASPDGDALGSELGLSRFLRSRGKTVHILNTGTLPRMYEWLPKPGEAETYRADLHDKVIAGTYNWLANIALNRYADQRGIDAFANGLGERRIAVVQIVGDVAEEQRRGERHPQHELTEAVPHDDARHLAQAARARVPGYTRPPDPQVQFGFMNYMLPNLAAMPTLGMRQLQVMQMLPLGGKLAMAGRVAGAQASAASERAQEVRWELRSEIAKRFHFFADKELPLPRRRHGTVI